MRRYSLQKYSLPSKIEHETFVSTYYTEDVKGILSPGEDTTFEASVKRYSLQKFSLPNRVETRINVSTYFIENVRALLGVGSDIILENSFSERLEGSVNLTRSAGIVSDMVEEVKSIVQLVCDFPYSFSMEEDITCVCIVYKNILINMNLAETLGNKLLIGKDTPIITAVSENVTSILLFGKNTPIIQFFGEAVHAIISFSTLEEDTIIINVTIPPGGDLRIDSENYIVTLNGVNIIHLQSGDWGYIDRRTLKVTVDSATGGKLTGQMLYNERYL